MECQRRGMDSCFINYRGLAGCELTTPKWYSAASVQDFVEPIDYVIQKYGGFSKIFTFGISLGANNLALLLGKPDLNIRIDAAVCFQAPTIIIECMHIVKNSLFGICDTGTGKNMLKKLKIHVQNTKVIAQFKEQYDIDFLDFIK